MTRKIEKAGVMIILYNPDLDRLKENLAHIVPQCSHILCIDNASANLEQTKVLLQQYEDIELMENTQNVGVAAALNQGMTYWEEKGLQWVLSLDQDSVCPMNLMEQLLQHVDLDEKIAIICPKIQNEGQGIMPSTGVVVDSNAKLRWIDDVITSGSLMSVEKWRALGGYDEQLFIDFVDVDLCIRIVKQGFRILEDSSVVLEHQIGETFTRKLLGKTFIVRNHSPFRKYYIIRNDIYIYKKKEQVLKNVIKFIAREMLLVVLYEKDKWKKVKSMCRGIIDGIKMKP